MSEYRRVDATAIYGVEIAGLLPYVRKAIQRIEPVLNKTVKKGTKLRFVKHLAIAYKVSEHNILPELNANRGILPADPTGAARVARHVMDAIVALSTIGHDVQLRVVVKRRIFGDVLCVKLCGIGLPSDMQHKDPFLGLIDACIPFAFFCKPLRNSRMRDLVVELHKAGAYVGGDPVVLDAAYLSPACDEDVENIKMFEKHTPRVSHEYNMFGDVCTVDEVHIPHFEYELKVPVLDWTTYSSRGVRLPSRSSFSLADFGHPMLLSGSPLLREEFGIEVPVRSRCGDVVVVSGVRGSESHATTFTEVTQGLLRTVHGVSRSGDPCRHGTDRFPRMYTDCVMKASMQMRAVRADTGVLNVGVGVRMSTDKGAEEMDRILDALHELGRDMGLIVPRRNRDHLHDTQGANYMFAQITANEEEGVGVRGRAAEFVRTQLAFPGVMELDKPMDRRRRDWGIWREACRHSREGGTIPLTACIYFLFLTPVGTSSDEAILKPCPGHPVKTKKRKRSRSEEAHRRSVKPRRCRVRRSRMRRSNSVTRTEIDGSSVPMKQTNLS